MQMYSQEVNLKSKGEKPSVWLNLMLIII